VAAKVQVDHAFKQPTPGGNGRNPDRPTPRPDKSLKEKKEKEKRNIRGKKRHVKEKRRSPSPRHKADLRSEYEHNGPSSVG
jgi:hypothetical protein